MSTDTEETWRNAIFYKFYEKNGGKFKPATQYTNYKKYGNLPAREPLIKWVTTIKGKYREHYKMYIGTPEEWQAIIDSMLDFNIKYNEETKKEMRMEFEKFWIIASKGSTVVPTIKHSDTDLPVAVTDDIPISEIKRSHLSGICELFAEYLKAEFTRKLRSDIDGHGVVKARPDSFADVIPDGFPDAEEEEGGDVSPQSDQPVAYVIPDPEVADVTHPEAIVDSEPEDYCKSRDPTTPYYDKCRVRRLFEDPVNFEKEDKEEFVTEQIIRLTSPELKGTVTKKLKPSIRERIRNFFQSGGKTRRRSKRKTKRNNKKILSRKRLRR